MSSSTAFGSPIPLSDIESVLAWVDTFKLSRPTKKINRDFSDAVLLAEILAVNYPKLVEMHNYPPRNSHALKLNNWMTLNRKVLKKLKLNLCCNTMEQLANSANGVIERVLVMVRDKIKHDEELERSTRDADANMSSGGSYYEACGDDEHVLVVPVKARVNGVLETIQQKVVSHDAYLALKEELKDAKDANELLKQKVEHLDSLVKLKDERIVELQKQVERKQSRRKLDMELPPANQNIHPLIPVPVVFDELPTPGMDTVSGTLSNHSIGSTKIPSKTNVILFNNQEKVILRESTTTTKLALKTSLSEVSMKDLGDLKCEVDRIKSDVFKEANVFEDRVLEPDEEYIDTEPCIVTIEDTINNELKDITKNEGLPSPIETS